MQLGVTIGYATTAVPQLTIPTTNISTFIQLQNQTNITNESYEYKTLKDDNFTTIEEKELYISDDSGSWFAAAFFLCGIFMSPFGGWLGGMIGRRKLILLSAKNNTKRGRRKYCRNQKVLIYKVARLR